MSIQGNRFKRNSIKENRPKRGAAQASGTAKKQKSRDAKINIYKFSEIQRKILKIVGLFLLISSITFAIAFISYLFTWQNDQSYISSANGGWNTLFKTAKELSEDGQPMILENKLGKLGALLANQFIYEWFGVASFIFIFILFILGYKLLYLRSLLPLGKSLIYAVTGILFTSLTLGFIQDFIQDTPRILEGKFGFWVNVMLNAQVGKVGVGALIVFLALSFLILIFNYDFKVSLWSNSQKTAKQTGEKASSLEQEDENSEENSTHDSELANQMREETKEKTKISQNLPSSASSYVKEESSSEDPLPLTINQRYEQQRHASAENEIKRTTVNSPKVEAPAAEEDSLQDIALDIEAPKDEDNEAESGKDLDMEVTVVEEEENVTSNDLVAEFGQFDPKLDLSGYQYPTLDLLNSYGDDKITINQEELEANKNRIVETLRNYNIEIKHIKATIGPTVTLYEIIPKPGVRISKIKNLEDDIALSLAALGIRIIAPMPGKGTIGIEVPNSKPELVSMRSVIAKEKFQKTDMDLPIALGKTISNEVYIADLAKMPHLLVAGATGQGKSVGINAILTSLLYKKHPAELKFVLVDPKKVELSLFKKIERHFLAKLPDAEEAIITDTTKVIHTLNSLCIEMDQRYDLLKDAQVRNLKEYNTKFINRRLNPENGHKYLPYIVLIVDEFADLMMTAGKEVETPIARLAQLARAVGIHLVIATQRPSVNIITGTIKANFPARLAFRVLSKVDSRTILDSGGADQLIGRGDMLLATGSDLIRLQCAFVDTPEVDKVSEFIGSQRAYPTAHLLPEYVDENAESNSGAIDLDDRDSMFDQAARLIVSHQQGSTSLIQRRLKLGYNRAGRIIDQLEAAGIVGPFEGSKAREVLIPDEYALEKHLESLNNPESN